ncbi:hypothetical protein DFA_00572 [Cavenderia fasciculata]|uniref:Short-chain dehydrogenase n=1 Tax=Cavenderia fasciculata TaxID=261658 RepID=F4PSL9_CACFS|nr:uncharacterized protein DFA_00572 [Cavenderia fasciculata]EGG20711.1 hypothetical protein DFA_00572 [Cavenderia fasciculata]|eukprot:XP_004358561.1 hypothetical protein DFA_00572 [Cavenderia fasciculata]
MSFETSVQSTVKFQSEKDGELDVTNAKYIAKMIDSHMGSYNIPKEKIVDKIIKLFETSLLPTCGKNFLFLMLGYLKPDNALALKEIFMTRANLKPYVPVLFNNLLFHQINLRHLSSLKHRFVSLFENNHSIDSNNNNNNNNNQQDDDNAFNYRLGGPYLAKPKDEHSDDDDEVYDSNNCRIPSNHRDLDYSSDPDELCPLLDVFQAVDGSRSLRFKDELIDDAEYAQVYYPAKHRVTNRVSVPSYPIFKDTFDVFTMGMLKSVDWDDGQGCKVVVAGGAVISGLFPVPQDCLDAWQQLQWARRAISSLPLYPRNLILQYLALEDDTSYHAMTYNRFFKNRHWATGDIDLFIIAKSAKDAKKRVMSLIDEVTANIPVQYRIIKTDRSVTILPLFPYRPVQIITTILSCPQDYLVYCDLDIATFIYDPPTKNIVTMDRGFWAFNNRYNVIGPAEWKISAHRCEKYYARGIGTLIFEVCKHVPRCDGIKEMPFHYDESNLPYGQHIATLETLDYILLASEPAVTVISSSDPPPLYNSPLSIGYRADILDEMIEISWKYNYDDKHFRKEKCYQCGIEIKMNIDGDQKIIDEQKDTTTKDTRQQQPDPLVCTKCRKTNNKKWNQWDKIKVDNSCASGKRYALVTGGRIKIGYEAAVRLLCSGFTVMVTTRFPYNAAKSFSEESTYEQWKDRLHVYGIDLRHLLDVDRLTEYVKKTFPRLDILINNAAQTIRRPRAYYHSLCNSETTLSALPNSNLQKLIVNNTHSINLTNNNNNIDNNNNMGAVSEAGNKLLSIIPLTPNNSKISAQMTQLVLHEQDVDEENTALFPTDLTDEHGEQLDLRTKTSWNMKIEEISPLEMLEVQVVNASVPFVLVRNLSALMGANCKHEKDGKGEKRRGGPTTPLVPIHENGMGWGFIINVSSPEGAFSGKESGFHVHTNMAKSALNMMTKSIATQYIKEQIYVVAVDPGWVTKMQPFGSEVAINEAPLTVQDGASRILDPIYQKLLGSNNIIQDAVKDPHYLPSDDNDQKVIGVRAQLVNSFMSQNHGCIYKHFGPNPW